MACTRPFVEPSMPANINTSDGSLQHVCIYNVEESVKAGTYTGTMSIRLSAANLRMNNGFNTWFYGRSKLSTFTKGSPPKRTVKCWMHSSAVPNSRNGVRYVIFRSIMLVDFRIGTCSNFSSQRHRYWSNGKSAMDLRWTLHESSRLSCGDCVGMASQSVQQYISDEY